MKVFELNPEPIAEICDIFNHPLSTQEEVAHAGIELFLYLYGKHYRFLIIVNFKIEHDSLKCHFAKKKIYEIALPLEERKLIIALISVLSMF